MSRELDLNSARWVKSSYSGGDGGECVEFSLSFVWEKSSYSGSSGGQCLEFSRTLAWEKSSHSGGDGGQCLEFSRTLAPNGVVPVRDSKNVAGGALVFPAGGWSSFVTAVRSGELTA